MSLRTRFLFHLAALAVVAAAGVPPSAAQSSARQPKETPKFELSAGSLGIQELPPLYWLDDAPADSADATAKRWVPFEVPTGSRGSPVKIPFKPPVQLYAGNPDEAKGTKMQPLLAVPVKKPGDRLFLFFFLDESGNQKHIFLEDADGSHPAGTVRVVNLTERRIAFSAGGNPMPLLPGGQQVVKPVLRDDGRFGFKHFEERAGGEPVESPLRYLRFPREGMRLLVVYAPVPVQPGLDENNTPRGPVTYQAEAIRFFDRQPGYVAGSAPRPILPASKVIGASTVAESSSPASVAPRECAFGILALGEKWLGGEIELGLAGQSGSLKAALQPGVVVPLKLPVAGEARITLRHSGSPLGEVSLGASATAALLALAPPAHATDPATASLFENSEQSHPRGRIRIFNLTPYQMAFTVAKSPVYVNPQESAIIESGSPASELPLKVALQVDGAWQLIDQSPRRAPGRDERAGLFIYPTASSGGSPNFAVIQKTL